MDTHRRRLPHQYRPGHPLFITWHQHGSLPAHVCPPGKVLNGEAFVWIDRHLDSAGQGPTFLRQPEIAGLIVESLRKGVVLRHYDLHAFVIMLNHVHVLLTPQIVPSHLLKSLKGCTAREANKLLGRTGQPFWQRESYDHWVRNDTEFMRIQAYIENNPVKAGLVTEASEYPWSSAAEH